jgi:hypothetical protein
MSQERCCLVYMVEGHAKGIEKGRAMLTEERQIARPTQPPRLEGARRAPVPEDRPEFSVPDLLGRILLVGVGFGLAFTGWMLMMTVILVFIGLPLFIFVLAVMQAQER